MSERNYKTSLPGWLSAEVHAEAMRSLPSVGAVMSEPVLAVGDDMSLDTAWHLMVQHRVTALPVVRGRIPVGVIELRDLVEPDTTRDDGGYPDYYRSDDDTAAGPVVSPDQIRPGQVFEVMHPFVLSIEASANLVQAAHRMLGEHVHRLLVCDGTNLVGVVTRASLLRGLACWFAPEVTLGPATPEAIGAGSGERVMAAPEAE